MKKFDKVLLGCIVIAANIACALITVVVFPIIPNIIYLAVPVQGALLYFTAKFFYVLFIEEPNG